MPLLRGSPHIPGRPVAGDLEAALLQKKVDLHDDALGNADTTSLKGTGRNDHVREIPAHGADCLQATEGWRSHASSSSFVWIAQNIRLEAPGIDSVLDKQAGRLFARRRLVDCQKGART